MSHESHNVAETIPQAMLFENAHDRRKKARIPCGGPVRLGPAHQPVRSSLVLEDLSAGGLFIRCPRPVQVGARFSVELPLPNGETLYVPEVEVIYNRTVSEEQHGFGGEFVNLPAEVEAKLIDFAKFDSMIAPAGRDVSASMIVYQESEVGPRPKANAPRVSDLRLSSLRPFPDTEPPTVALRVFDGTRREDVSTLRVRKDKRAKVNAVWSELGDAPALDQELVLEPTTSGFAGELEISNSEAPPLRANRIGRRSWRPAIVVAAGFSGLLVLGSVVLKSSKNDNRAYAEATVAAETNGLSAETHSMLTGQGHVEVAAKKPAAPAESVAEAPRNPLPEPVDIEKLARERQAQRPASPSPVRAGPESAEPESPSANTPTAAAKMPSASTGPVDARLSVSSGATVLRSFVLKSPARFVVDLAHQVGVPDVKSGSARVGMHEGYVRIVVDSPTALRSGTAQKRGESLEIQLQR